MIISKITDVVVEESVMLKLVTCKVCKRRIFCKKDEEKIKLCPCEECPFDRDIAEYVAEIMCEFCKGLKK